MHMRKPAVFYGWWGVTRFSFMTLTPPGLRPTVGPFLKPISADLGLDRATFSIVIAVSLFLYGLFGPLTGVLPGRVGGRVTAVAGTFLLVASLLLTGLVRNFWEFFFVYGVLLSL